VPILGSFVAIWGFSPDNYGSFADMQGSLAGTQSSLVEMYMYSQTFRAPLQTYKGIFFKISVTGIL